MRADAFTNVGQVIMPRPSAAILLEDANLCVNCNLIHGEHSCPLCCSDHAIKLATVLNNGKARTAWHTPSEADYDIPARPREAVYKEIRMQPPRMASIHTPNPQKVGAVADRLLRVRYCWRALLSILTNKTAPHTEQRIY